MVARIGHASRIVIEPVTRVEGHGKVTILLDDAQPRHEARLHIVEFRGFERFIQGRPFWEMPVVVQRLCGICPVSHHLCAAKAIDNIVGVDRLTPTAEKMRRLMHYGQMFQSHCLHFFHLASPDLLFGFDADPASAMSSASSRPPRAGRPGGPDAQVRPGDHPGHRRQEDPRHRRHPRRHQQEPLDRGARQRSVEPVDQMRAWSRAAVDIARRYTLENLDLLKGFGSFESNHLSIVRDDGALDLYDGGLRAIDPDGATIFDHVPAAAYLDHIAEEVRDWSYMKFPFIRSIGPERGWYRVGPLWRASTHARSSTPPRPRPPARSSWPSPTAGQTT
jgi:NAD-reducing hydrogenase large subunit